MSAEDIDAALKAVQLEAAKLDLEIKRLDLQNKPKLGLAVLSNPVVVSGAIAAFVTISSGILATRFHSTRSKWMIEGQKRSKC